MNASCFLVQQVALVAQTFITTYFKSIHFITYKYSCLTAYLNIHMQQQVRITVKTFYNTNTLVSNAFMLQISIFLILTLIPCGCCRFSAKRFVRVSPVQSQARKAKWYGRYWLMPSTRVQFHPKICPPKMCENVQGFGNYVFEPNLFLFTLSICNIDSRHSIYI